ncbi:hypothetical protein DW228_18320 [Bacteroides fragilis]|uniref:ATP-grasp domain-containing protein n=1 Tax=Bacteroides fragilis TaxID=817 RepID=A0A396BUS2_BACFG|nr:hypothetical protein [Bacteroides fragilis]RHH07889.1 hypothetical protein DW228_18320 [Bacteroides fragilis]
MTSKIGFLYLGDRYKEEEKIVATNFVTIRLTSVTEVNGNVSKLKKCDYVFLRGGKYQQADYEKIYNLLKKNEINVTSSAASYKIANSAMLYSELLGIKAPSLYVFSAKQTDDEIISSFGENVNFPLFVRSEKESAAKYVGVNGCVVLENNSELFKMALANLRNNVKDIKEIIFKQVIPIKQFDNKRNLEYRAIIFRGKLICFDYEETLPNPSDYDLDKFVAEVSLDLFRRGFDGGFFMDFAIKKEGGFFAVECKDLINGTIKNIDEFIRGLKKNC